MNSKELKSTLESMGMRPGRGLGQNFLLDNNLLDFIVRSGAPQAGENILEVGPGFGALTGRLLNAGAELYSVEFDHRLADYLRGHLTSEHFHLVEADACRVDYQSLFEGKSFRCIANLPYAISSVFIARLLELANPPAGMLFLLQREMGERLAAKPGCGAYGALSVRVQLLYRVELVRVVPPEVFYPPPEVDSAVVRFTLREELPAIELRRRLGGVVKTAFAQRRKKMAKVLGAAYTRERVESAMQRCGIDLDIRPEKLSVTDFIKLVEDIFELD